MIRTKEEHLAHYGTPRRSGRYPWGSGGNNKSFLEAIAEQRKAGLTDAQIAKNWGMSRNELTARRSIANAQQRQAKILQAQRLKEKGWGPSAIGRRMGVPESSVRAMLQEGALDKVRAHKTTADMLRAQVDAKGMIDIGKGVEHHIAPIGVSKDRLKVAVEMLKQEGYGVHTVYIPQANLPGQFTPMLVLAKPGITNKEVQRNRSNIKQITDYSDDNGRSFFGLKPPISIDSKRIEVNYGPDGGKEADGVIFVRRGVKDVQIGDKNYAQVRIAVDGTHYIKGMAVYKDDMPPGVDLIFNTNKPSTGNKLDVMKPLKDDPENPFGSIYRQVHDDKGNVTSAMNIVNEEGTWDKWSNSLSSQMLSKQSPALAKQQLDITYNRSLKEYEEIKSLTNPVIRKELLKQFGDEVDSRAVHLKAASMPRQENKVILPIQSIKPGEVYNPGLKDGTRVILIRHPHGGTFEIPQLTVNNKNPEARKILGTNPPDAIGIHHTVAQRLSGADFDGDTVLVIPNPRKQISSTPALDGLKNFDPIVYAVPPGSPVPRINTKRKNYEMGKISNLITDMTIKGADSGELARAIRHSMVVIDSEKHHLDFKLSERDNGIRALKEKYQGRGNAGASTIISRAGAEVWVDEMRLRSSRRGGTTDPKTGKKVWELTGRTRPEKKYLPDPITGKKRWVETGRQLPIKSKHERLSITDDAFDLIDPKPGKVIERVYANHSNRLKALANEARKESLQIKPPRRDSVAYKHYSSEVKSLNHKLRKAEFNAPLERQAQLLASVHVAQVKRNNPDIDKDELKKIQAQALNIARNRTGANKEKIDITNEEWHAIQAGAVSPSTLTRILANSKPERLKELALPKTGRVLSANDLRRAKAMMNSGATQAEVADALGVGLTTLKVNLKEAS